MSEDDISRTYLLDRFLLLSDESRKPLRLRCKFYYHPQQAVIDFVETLHEAQRLHPQIHALLEGKQLFYIDQKRMTKHFLGNFPFEHPATTPYDNWTATTITVVYRKLPSQQKQVSSIRAAQPKKSRERTIKEVKRSLVLWREAYERGEVGKGHTLIGAARTIGVSKKSLQDYFRFLKLGEQLDFDFEGMSEQKMGVLRAYVRQKLQLRQMQIVDDPDCYWDISFRASSEVA